MTPNVGDPVKWVKVYELRSDIVAALDDQDLMANVVRNASTKIFMLLKVEFYVRPKHGWMKRLVYLLEDDHVIRCPVDDEWLSASGSHRLVLAY